jgi:hypothetical protein
MKGEVMFCGNCGNRIDDDAVFCGYCGEPVNRSPEGGEESSSRVTDEVLVTAEKLPVEPPKKGRAIYIILASTLAVLLISAAMVFIFVIKPFAQQPDSGSMANQDKGQIGNSVEDTFDGGDQAIDDTADDSEEDESDEEYESDGIVDSFDELQDADYILSFSDSRLITANDLTLLSDFELYIARNEIYARRGRGFKKQDLQDYFGDKSWYVAKYSPDEFDNSVTLSNTEIKNAVFIRDEEKRRNSKYS